MIAIVVDANIIISALLGGKPSIILFDAKFQFTTSQFTINEVIKYFPKIAKKLNVPERELLSALNDLPLLTYDRNFYEDKLKSAKEFIGQIDKKDIEILALALKLETPLWSEDKHFEKSAYHKLLKTYNFI